MTVLPSLLPVVLFASSVCFLSPLYLLPMLCSFAGGGRSEASASREGDEGLAGVGSAKGSAAILALRLYQMARNDDVRIGLRLCELMIGQCCPPVASCLLLIPSHAINRLTSRLKCALVEHCALWRLLPHALCMTVLFVVHCA